MNRSKTLVKNTFIISVGNICTKLVTFLLLPLYTSFLSTEEYGIVELLTTLVTLLLPLISFQIEQAVFRNLIDNRNNEESKKTIISSSVFIVAIQCIIFTLLFIIFSTFINNQYKYYLLLCVIANIFTSIFLQIARGLGFNTKYAIGSFISATTTIVLNVVFLVLMKLNVVGMFLSIIFGHIIAIIYLFFGLKIYKYLSFLFFDFKYVKKLWSYSVPLIPNAISWWIFNSSDRVIVSIFLGIASTGILSAAYKFSSAYIMIYNIFNTSWTESISVNINDGDINVYFNHVFNIILNLFICIGILLIALMPFIWPIMINSKFNDGYNLVPILILSSIFNVMVGLLSAIYLAKKDTKSIAITSILAASINICTHLVLIKLTGLYAAALSTLIAYFTIAIYRLIDVKRRYFAITIKKDFVIVSVILCSIVLISYYLNNLIVSGVIVILVILYVVKYNFLTSKKLIGFILKKHSS